ncbi:MAG: hypothetical protein Q7J25_07965 [Vicinamibacterales bacterium]|nr:hypothetical protein [Vicinamibacterales bacterium]
MRPGRELHALMTHKPSSVCEASPNVVRLEPRILAQENVRGIPRSEHAEHMFNRQTVPADNRFASENPRIGRNTREQIGLRSKHDRFYSTRFDALKEKGTEE